MVPRKLNFSMPPEWAEHARTFMEWPVQAAMCWPDNYEQVCMGFVEIAQAIVEFEPVAMLVNPEDLAKASRLCGPKVELLAIEHNDSWMRDNGPTFLINKQGEVAGVNWQFNAWGGKYVPWDLDNQVAPKLLKHLEIPCFQAPFVLEGGAIHVDGEGTLLTTEECLLNQNRNAGVSREELAELLKQHLNVDKVIWLKRGLYGDETDGHIDNVACFAKPGSVILQTCQDPEDPNYQITMENLKLLQNTTDAKGRKLSIIPIQQPPARFYQGSRLTLSYLNFYFVNGGIILPVFGEESKQTDLLAEQTLQQVFPERKIVKIDGMSIIKEGGNVHCITQQMPIGSPAKL